MTIMTAKKRKNRGLFLLPFAYVKLLYDSLAHFSPPFMLYSAEHNRVATPPVVEASTPDHPVASPVTPEVAQPAVAVAALVTTKVADTPAVEVGTSTSNSETWMEHVSVL